MVLASLLAKCLLPLATACVILNQIWDLSTVEFCGEASFKRAASCEVTDNKAQSLPQRTQETQRRCPVCAALPRVAQTMLDSRQGKIVRLFHCQCGEYIWDD